MLGGMFVCLGLSGLDTLKALVRALPPTARPPSPYFEGFLSRVPSPGFGILNLMDAIHPS